MLVYCLSLYLGISLAHHYSSRNVLGTYQALNQYFIMSVKVQFHHH